MGRKEELLKVFEGLELVPIVSKTIDEIEFMEKKLDEYKAELSEKPTARNKEKYAFYNKLYLDTMAKHNTAVQTLLRIAIKEDTGEESPLREFFNRLKAGGEIS